MKFTEIPYYILKDFLTGTPEVIYNSEFSLTVSAGEGGSISPSSSPITYGSSITFTFGVDETHCITDVIINDISYGGEITEYTVSFVKNDITITLVTDVLT
jgi:hypothetical protein